MPYELLVQQMTMIISVLATACFVCAQVKVEHPVIGALNKKNTFLSITVRTTNSSSLDFLICNQVSEQILNDYGTSSASEDILEVGQRREVGLICFQQDICSVNITGTSKAAQGFQSHPYYAKHCGGEKGNDGWMGGWDGWTRPIDSTFPTAHLANMWLYASYFRNNNPKQ